MKRRNDDDVGPVQNGIARLVPEAVHRARVVERVWKTLRLAEGFRKKITVSSI
jgi:hypothetical protein